MSKQPSHPRGRIAPEFMGEKIWIVPAYESPVSEPIDLTETGREMLSAAACEFLRGQADGVDAEVLGLRMSLAWERAVSAGAIGSKRPPKREGVA